MDWKQTITEVIEEFIDSPENTLGNDANDRAFEKPLVGFAGGDDPAFEECKRHIGSFYWTPWEIFEKSFPSTKMKPGELTIISWILPIRSRQKWITGGRKPYPPNDGHGPRSSVRWST